MKTVLIIDDEEKLRSLLSRIIRSEGFEVFDAATCKAGMKKLEQCDVDTVLCDVKLPDGNGVDLVKDIKAKYPEIEVVLLTAYGNIPDGIQAIKNGAFDYIIKGDDNSKIIPLLHRANEKAALAKRVGNLEKQVGGKYSFENILGRSKSILSAVSQAKKVAGTDATVLLLGETGTGKEVFAQAIHYGSKRKQTNFVAVNCSAFSRELLENELFGHKAGSFTGAIKDTKGLFEEANEGTIFLDEIGEMNLELQAKLLRVLETGEFHKVGDSQTKKIDVRIIAATNRDLEQEIKAGNFREDLFYRLSVFQVRLPSLRERVSDIEIFANHFATLFSAKTNKRTLKLSDDFIAALKQYHWPGNIRELKNLVERCVILSEGEILQKELLPYEMLSLAKSSNHSLSAFSLASVEKLHIQKVLNYTKGNKAETARLLEIGIATLYRKIDEFGL